MPTRPPKQAADGPERNVTFLRPGDQRTLTGIVVVLLLVIAASTTWYALRCGGLVHVDQLPANTYTFQVDLNTADWTEISALPNIGEKMAQRIVEFRETHGSITSLRALMQINGIGPRTILAIQPYVPDLPLSDEMIADSQ